MGVSSSLYSLFQVVPTMLLCFMPATCRLRRGPEYDMFRTSSAGVECATLDPHNVVRTTVHYC